MSLNTHVAEVLRMLENGEHSGGELVLVRDHARRWEERPLQQGIAALNAG